MEDVMCRDRHTKRRYNAEKKVLSVYDEVLFLIILAYKGVSQGE